MSSPIPLDPYEVLGVARDATLPAIRSAHRKLALKFHPDRIKDEAERKRGSEEFQKAQQAYELLADDKRRARYDDQVRLAALRKDAMMAGDRGVPIRSTTFPMQQQAPQSRPPPPPPSSTYEYRDGRMYEERRPRHMEEEERYAEPPRPSARKAASTYERRPATSYSEEKKKKHSDKSSGFTGFMENKLREKARQARERAAHTESAKSRDKERRKETEAKYAPRRTYVEDYDESSSDSDTITYVSKKPETRRRANTYDTPPKKAREPERKQPTRRSRKTSRDSDSSSSSSSSEEEDWQAKDAWASRHRDAAAYISERSVPGRPSVLRTDAAHYVTPRERSSGKSGSDKDDLREERPRSSKTSRPVVVP